MATLFTVEGIRGLAYRILVVDDEPDILVAVCSVLETCRGISCEVKGFSEPLMALDYFEQDPAAFDLLITDVRMPRMIGFELAKKVNDLRPGTKVIFMSAFEVDERTPGYPKALKKEDILRKPHDLLELCKILEKYIAHSS